MFYGLQFLLFIFLLLKDNFAELRNEETEAAVLQAAGFVKNGPADAQTGERDTRRESSLGG